MATHAQGLNHMLEAMHVQYLVVPSVPTRAGMWRQRFGFSLATKQEAADLDHRIVLPDPEYSTLLKRPVGGCVTLLCHSANLHVSKYIGSGKTQAGTAMQIHS